MTENANTPVASAQQPDGWGTLGQAMLALNERQRNFVRALLTGKPGYGSVTKAYRAAGYRAAHPNREAYSLVRNPKIIEAIMIRDPKHREHGRAAAAILDRVDPVVTTQKIERAPHRPDRRGDDRAYHRARAQAWVGPGQAPRQQRVDRGAAGARRHAADRRRIQGRGGEALLIASTRSSPSTAAGPAGADRCVLLVRGRALAPVVDLCSFDALAV
jgi:hypothetical protein